MSQTSLAFPGTVQSVVKSQRNGPLIATAAVLWINDDDRVLDVTYGRGNFWTDYRPANLETHDIRLDGVDFRNLPEPDASVDVVVFDPPYIAQGGRETSTVTEFMDAYGLVDVPKRVTDVEVLIKGGIDEAARVLKPHGRLLMKCMNYVNGGAFVTGHQTACEFARWAGLAQVDEFIHYSGTGPQPKRTRQLHSRSAHSFLCVFRKPKR